MSRCKFALICMTTSENLSQLVLTDVTVKTSEHCRQPSFGIIFMYLRCMQSKRRAKLMKLCRVMCPDEEP